MAAENSALEAAARGDFALYAARDASERAPDAQQAPPGWEVVPETATAALRRYADTLGEVAVAAAGVFGDTDPEFATAGGVLSKLAAWRRDAPKTYHDAYMPLNVPALVAPHVRLALATWHPLFPAPEGNQEESEGGNEVHQISGAVGGIPRVPGSFGEQTWFGGLAEYVAAGAAGDGEVLTETVR